MSNDAEILKKQWDERAERYDTYYEDFSGAVEHYVDWEVLKGHLPENKDARILDAAGGTGRITLPLAKMGYSVTLCDISPGMLKVARQKLLREGLLEKVEVVECDVRKLPFDDESFDFVLCWDGGAEATSELVRVTKKGGKISVYLVNKCGAAIGKFREDPDAALALLASEPHGVCDDEEKRIAVTAEEAKGFFEKEGIRVIETYAVCGMLEWLPISKEIQESRRWDERFFRQVTEMLLRLNKEPSVKGLSRHLAMYGEKI
ncbi:MAG: class I SAM-dependent methyltransferase [Calditrichaeota bacterium]|nr:class I SAM-dependent methyltransferase [Calditrichota bacterium]